jgi:DNA-binding transcriptional LysR family regulator
MMPMDGLDGMRVFVAVADAGGFSPAARRLGMSPPAVTRAVAALEARIGTRLLHRTTRVVRLTEAGARFLADSRRILAEVEDAEAAAAGSHAELRGSLAVTASAMFGRMHVTPLALEFLRRHPRVALRTLFVDRVVHLVEEGIDVAVRIGRLPDSSLTAVRVGLVRRVVCAAPSYLAARGTPASPAELASHDVVAFSGITPSRQWSFHTAAGAVIASISPRFTTNSPDVAIAAALAGYGVTSLLSYMIAREIAAGALVTVLSSYEPPPLPVHVVHHAGRQASARVRAFVDHAVANLRANSAVNSGRALRGDRPHRHGLHQG